MSKSRSQRLPNTIPEDDDGYTLTRYLAGRAGLHGPLRFTYRPVSGKKKMALRDYARGKTQEELLDSVAQALSSQLDKWDAIDHNGEPLSTGWKSVRQLHPSQADDLADVILWSTSAGDIDPDEKGESDGKSWFSPPDEKLLEGEQKNSPAP